MSFRPGRLAYHRREVGGRDASVETLERVTVNHESVIFAGARIYPESFAPDPAHRAHWERPSRYAWFLAQNYALRRAGAAVDTALWVIDDMSPDNYYHWLIDCLARLVDAERLCPDVTTLLLPRYYQRNPFVEFTLRAFPQITVRWIERQEKVRVEHLAWVPRRPAYYQPGHPAFNPQLVGEVARRVGELTGTDGSNRRLYFTRARAARRRAVNEADVVRVLREHEVEVFEIDASRPWEQIAASRSAELLIGVHGAALSNMIFLPSHGRVLELQRRRATDDRYFYDVFGGLARDLGVAYTTQACVTAEPVVGPDSNDADLIVDLDQLRENLRGAELAH